MVAEARGVASPMFKTVSSALMANLPWRLTGLPTIVWVQERGDACHDVRIKVNPTHSHRIDYHHLVSVTLQPQPHIIAPGSPSPQRI